MTDKIQSNKLLRALWAAFRMKFGKCSWLYAPSKDGVRRSIDFGSMNIREETMDVGITYERKGVIKSIYFKDIEEKSGIGQDIKNIVNETKSSLEPIPQYVFLIKLASFFPLSEYHADNFSVKPISDIESLLKLTVSGYDEKDARYQMLTNLENIMAILSIETNCPFWISKSPASYSKDFNGNNGLYTEDLDWMDGYPYKNQCITISQKGLAVLNEIAGTYLEISPRVEKFIKSCHQFHLARKQDAQVWDSNNLRKIKDQCNLEIGIGEDAGQTEIATVLYMSSLESAASIDQTDKNYCEKCGQPTYSIANRVMNFVEEFSDPAFATWVKMGYYSKRSKFLHVGETLTNMYIGVSIPMLDENGEGKCMYAIALVNTREHTSYCLRKLLYDKL